ncbi:MAG: hypothetical protein ACOC2U_04505 [bacterium]
MKTEMKLEFIDERDKAIQEIADKLYISANSVLLNSSELRRRMTEAAQQLRALK